MIMTVYLDDVATGNRVNSGKSFTKPRQGSENNDQLNLKSG